MNKWLDAKECLPPLDIPVLCIIKNSCECDHYSQAVFARIQHDNNVGGYAWYDGQGTNVYHPGDILYWQKLPPMLEGFEAGYPEFH
jgi:hypothetical protein